MRDLVERARAIAIAAHGSQMYGTNEPYTDHLEEVANEVRRLTDMAVRPLASELIAAAWLHDVIEDTQESAASLLEAGMPVYVVALVDAVTDRPGRNRAERHAMTYPRLARMPDAVIVKQADRIANVRACLRKKDPRIDMYRREYQVFRKALSHYGVSAGWAMLDDMLSAPAVTAPTETAAECTGETSSCPCQECLIERRDEWMLPNELTKD